MSIGFRLQDPFFTLYEQRIKKLPVAIGMIEKLERPNKEDIELKKILNQELKFNKFYYLKRLGVFTRLLDDQ